MACQSPRRVRNSWKRGTGTFVPTARHPENSTRTTPFSCVGLSEADGQGRTGIADEIRTAHRLRDMKMSQGKVVDARGEDIRPDLGQGADIQFAHPIAVNGLAACCEQMPHGDNRDRLFQQGTFPRAAS